MSAGWDAEFVFEMDDTYRTGLAIMHQQRTSPAGARFDFRSWSWKVPDPKK